MGIRSILPDTALIGSALRCLCPRCASAPLFKGKFSLSLHAHCPSCSLNLDANDSADGPAVFLIFILGCLLVPPALFLEWIYAPPLWVHAALWGAVTLFLTLIALRPLKAYVIGLQYKYRPRDWM